MKKVFKSAIALVLFLLATTAQAQYIQVDDHYTAQQLVENVLLNNGCASVSNISVTGAAYTGEQSYGYFSGTGSTFPFQNGIILSTGKALGAVGPNSSLLDDGGDIDWPGDRDLENALQINNSINATVLEFDFIPLANRISFDYMLSSEEYHDNAPCRYSDGFAFLLKAADDETPYINLAVVPGTDIPVKVTSVRPEIPGSCEAQNEQYFGAFNGYEHPTNFNGQTKVMTAISAVTPGVRYHIKLVVADEANFRYDSAIFIGGGSFDMTTDLGPDRTLANGNPLCDGEVFTIDASSTVATAYQWYKDGNIISGATNGTYTVNPTTDSSPDATYTVDVTFTPGCISQGAIDIEYTTPVTVGSYTLLQCDDNNDGLTLYNLDNAAELVENNHPELTGVNYFTELTDAEANTNEITEPNLFANTRINQQVYIRMKNQYNCIGIATVTLATSANTVNDATVIEECDDDGTDDGLYVFDLTQRAGEILSGLPTGLQLDYYISHDNALTVSTPIANPQSFNNTIAYNQVIYARVSSGSDCYGIAQIPLLVHSFGAALDDEEVFLCEGATVGVPLNAGPGYASYTWDTNPIVHTQIARVSQTGTYTVTVANNFGCTGTKTFVVKPSGKAINAEFEIVEFTGGNNSLTIHPEGIGTYEYSIDGVHYQDSPVFDNLPSGQYTVYIRDTNGCGSPYTKEVAVLDYPKYFTPNGDTVHEYWSIPYMRNRPGISVVIYDRYGKVITGFTGGNYVGWDGTLNGHPLPASDYWFVITLENGNTVKGHFALIR
ncbi:T9SS type B sorting domain-containing protein [Flavobacterium sp. Sd200]|uniref:T9SS type B sorting domain-containing protein n=1 Tax=Flavobacterium sp. Sd200 TaxID=2692211 RepID=UPI001370FF44|nr:choice-of-anchor L domain-containing protein [Flavobacterium sp. Sd200]MXN92931.1 T9SS type B sorting domain-containing protein [Flavobacterium sp. Sd200]